MPRPASSAAIYCRISEDPRGEGLGVARQEADCRALAERLGWTVGRVYIDNDTSAYKRGRPRKAYTAMLDAVRAGRHDAILAYRSDRLYRRADDLEDFIRVVEDAGIPVETVASGHVDLTTAHGRLTARILGATAAAESEVNSERVRRAIRERVEQGLPGGGSRPFGYEDDKRTIRESEADEIRKAAARILAGDSLRSVVLDWRARVPAPQGGQWVNHQVKRALTSPRTAGLREHTPGDDRSRTYIAGRAVWPGILTPETRDELLALFNTPGRGAKGPSPRTYLLTGLLFCGVCEHRLRTVPVAGQSGSANYGCPPKTMGGCGGVFIRTHALDDYIRVQLVGGVLPGVRFKYNAATDEYEPPGWAVFSPRLDLKAMVRAQEAGMERPDLSSLYAELRDVEARQGEIADRYADGKLDYATFDRIRARLDERYAKLTDQRDRATRGTTGLQLLIEAAKLGGRLSEEYWDWPIDRQRQLVDSAVQRITIYPSRGKWNKPYVQRGRVDILWQPHVRLDVPPASR